MREVCQIPVTTAAHTKCSCSADFKLAGFKQASATPSAISMPETKGAEGRGSMRRERHEQHRVREAVRQPRAASCGNKEWSRAELGRRGNFSEQKGCCPMHFCCF